MQPLTDGPRTNLTERLVRALLQSDRTIQITYGADALDEDFGFVADIGGYMSEGSEVSSAADAIIHRTCTLNIDSDVTETGWSYLSGFVKPYMVITDPQSKEEARFNLGVYSLTTPQRDLGTEPATLNFQGYDLIYLLQQPIGDSYEVPAGSDPAQAAAEVIGLAIPEVEVQVEDSGSTTTQPLSWPFDPESPTTFLDVVQALLAAIGYKPVWVDWEGRFRVEPFEDLQEADIEWSFDLNDEFNIVSDERSQDVDLYNVPNWWRFVMADLPDTPVEGVTMFTWEDSSPLNPGSTVNRGRRLRHIEEVPSTSFEDLVDYAQRKIAATLEPAERFTVKTQPFPLAWHFDLIEFTDDALATALPTSPGNRRLVSAVTWKLRLDGTDDMEWEWQSVVDQSALGVYELVDATSDPATRDINSGSFAGTFTLALDGTGSNILQFIVANTGFEDGTAQTFSGNPEFGTYDGSSMTCTVIDTDSFNGTYALDIEWGTPSGLPQNVVGLVVGESVTPDTQLVTGNAYVAVVRVKHTGNGEVHAKASFASEDTNIVPGDGVWREMVWSFTAPGTTIFLGVLNRQPEAGTHTVIDSVAVYRGAVSNGFKSILQRLNFDFAFVGHPPTPFFTESFEGGTGNWTPNSLFGTATPATSCTVETVEVDDGLQSLDIEWAAPGTPLVQGAMGPNQTGLIAESNYLLKFRYKSPNSGLGINLLGRPGTEQVNLPPSAGWSTAYFAFATGVGETSAQPYIITGDPAAGEHTYIDKMEWYGPQ